MFKHLENYGLVVRTEPATEPVTQAELIDHLREDASIAQTDLIDSLIVAARQWAETYTARAFITTEYTLSLDSFGPIGDWWPESYFATPIRLPRSVVQSVDEIRYIDTDGTQQILASSKYRVDLASLVARVTPAYGETWPTPRTVSNAVEIDFTAGYGDAATDVPEGIKHAIKILAGTWYNCGRDAIVIGTSAMPIPMTVEFLLGPYRIATHPGSP